MTASRSRSWLAALLAGLLLAVPVVAEEPAKPPAAAGAGVLQLLPAPVTTRHELVQDGRRLAYAATAGTLPLRDTRGEITAAIFHVAYVLDPPDATRPVTFVFNGGPGAASAFLLLGALGPRLVAFSPEGGYLPPPARLLDNPDGWLPFTDLVFVDPVGTGYSRAAAPGEEAERRFFGVRQDASAMAAFIRLWLARNGRTLAPVFLVGESYGGFRAAVLARTLQDESGIAPSGLVLISPALAFALLRPGRDDDHMLLPFALTLPAMAAVHLERQGQEELLTARLPEIERWALSDYLVALAAGPRALPPGIVERLAALTGLASDLVRQSWGRIPVGRFIKEYARAQGRVLSRYDGAVDGPDPDPASPRASGPDPVLDRAVPVWTSAFVAYVRGELGYTTDIDYRLLEPEISGKWDYGTAPGRQGYADALDDLEAGRTLNPSLEVLIAHGYTDLVTPYLGSRYLLDQLPPLAGAAPITFRVYPGGHMPYMRAGSRHALLQDAKALYERALAAREEGGGK
ncbi:S10 family peptidase [Benzoatithermus flavus]|uniref:Carboxypeptidase C (Cathepsin A) n=1 Tax=Benzoatithermus flavus TaxID=3108223 RepID=A0ABU8XVY6_9PROT